VLLGRTEATLTEQLEKDIEKAAGTLDEAKNGATKLRKELATLAKELSASEVR
jgi:predicted kinase